MDLGSFLILIAIIIVVVLIVIIPLFDPKLTAKRLINIKDNDPEEREKQSLMVEQERILNALQEFDNDYAMGKVMEEEYTIQRAELIQEGADNLKKLESLSSTNKLQAGTLIQSVEDPGIQLDWKDDQELEQRLDKRRKIRQSESSGFCPRCGQVVSKGDRFCAKCGYMLE